MGLLPLNNPATNAVDVLDGTNASEADNTQDVARAAASESYVVRGSPRPMRMFIEELEQYGTATDAHIGTMAPQREDAQIKLDTATKKKTLQTTTALQKESPQSPNSPINKPGQTQEESSEPGKPYDESHASSTATPIATSETLDGTAHQQTPKSSSQRKSRRADSASREATDNTKQSRQESGVVVSPPQKNTDMTQLEVALYSSSIVAPSQSQSRSKTHNVVTLQPTARMPLLDHEREGIARLQEEDFEMDDLDAL